MPGNDGKRYTLSLDPVDISLTAGTNIPAPLDSPPRSPASVVRRRTPGGGRLTSHPTTPDAIPGAFPPTPEPEQESGANTPSNGAARQERADSFKMPVSPASAGHSQTTSSPEPEGTRSGVRKLLSLSSLRSSFNSSRTSLMSLPRQSHDVPAPQQHQYNQQYPTTSSLKRPSFSSAASTKASSFNPRRPELRPKKSGSWFRRKSRMLVVNGDNTLDAVDENRENQWPETRESKRLKEEPAPLLPAIGTLSGGYLGGGELGWDESIFKR